MQGYVVILSNPVLKWIFTNFGLEPFVTFIDLILDNEEIFAYHVHFEYFPKRLGYHVTVSE